MQLQNLSYSPNFNANLKSPKLRFKQDDFFVRIRGYGKDKNWANSVKETADTAVKLVRSNTIGEYVLKYITAGVTKANQASRDLSKSEHTGILRTARYGWKHGSNWDGFNLCTSYSDIKRYSSYEKRFDEVANAPLTNPYDDISLTILIIEKHEKYLKHGVDYKICNALFRVQKLYNELTENYKPEDVTNKSLNKITDKIAEMRWILAHATPWERGSDAISNIFMRALYKSFGIKTYPLAKGVSLDLEAYCTELKDYKAKFHSYFEKPPVVIEK